MKLGHLVFYVSDPVQSSQFYERAFGLSIVRNENDGAYIEMDGGGIILGFAADTLMHSLLPVDYHPNTTTHPPAGIQISFRVDNLEQGLQHALAAGALSVTPPELKPWGLEVAYIRDPNGIFIELCRKCSPQIPLDTPDSPA